MKAAHLTTVDLSLRYLVFAQLRGIVESGGEAIGISAPGPWTDELERAQVRHVPLAASTRGMRPVDDLRAALQLWGVLRRERPDVLHTHNPKPGLYGRVVGRLAGVPIVVNTLHGLYATESDPFAKRMLVYAFEALAARFSDAELVQSPEDYDLLRRWRIYPPLKTRLLGNGVDLERFSPDRFESSVRQRVRESLGVDDGQVLVGMVGRLVAEKGYPELVSAAEKLPESYRVIAVGPRDPDKADAVPEEIFTRARHAGVQLLGMRTDVDELYAAMDLFVLPSHREGFPRAAMEAAAMGLPIVATDIRGCRQVVEHGVNGLLVPVGRPQELAAAIMKFGDDPGLRKRMGESSRRRAVEHFDEQRVVEIVMETYRRAARAKGWPDPFPGVKRQVEVRLARVDDVPGIAKLHRESIETGFLPRLGLRFLRRLYRAMIDWQASVVLVADGGAGPVGFVSGVEDVGAFYRHFLRRHGLAAVIAALPKLVRPASLRRAWETLRYGGEQPTAKAELLSMAVSREARGQGVGGNLGSSFLQELSNRGVHEIKVVVGTDNEVALGTYRKLGFVDHVAMEVHAGEPSMMLVWRG